MKKKIGGIPFDELKEEILDNEFTTYPRIRDIDNANPKSKKRTKNELNEKNEGRVCGIYKVGSKYVGSVYIKKGTTVFVELNEEEVSAHLF